MFQFYITLINFKKKIQIFRATSSVKSWYEYGIETNPKVVTLVFMSATKTWANCEHVSKAPGYQSVHLSLCLATIPFCHMPCRLYKKYSPPSTCTQIHPWLQAGVHMTWPLIHTTSHTPTSPTTLWQIRHLGDDVQPPTYALETCPKCSRRPKAGSGVMPLDLRRMLARDGPSHPPLIMMQRNKNTAVVTSGAMTTRMKLLRSFIQQWEYLSRLLTESSTWCVNILTTFPLLFLLSMSVVRLLQYWLLMIC